MEANGCLEEDHPTGKNSSHVSNVLRNKSSSIWKQNNTDHYDTITLKQYCLRLSDSFSAKPSVSYLGCLLDSNLGVEVLSLHRGPQWK